MYLEYVVKGLSDYIRCYTLLNQIKDLNCGWTLNSKTGSQFRKQSGPILGFKQLNVYFLIIKYNYVLTFGTF